MKIDDEATNVVDLVETRRTLKYVAVKREHNHQQGFDFIYANKEESRSERNWIVERSR